METLADPPPDQDAPDDPSSPNEAEGDGDDWLGPAEAEQIEAVACGMRQGQRPAKKDWVLALAAAVILHALCIVALAATLSRFIPIRWHVGRGDSVVSAGSSAPGQEQPDDPQPIAQGISAPPLPPSPSQVQVRPGELSAEDSSALSQSSASPIPESPDAVIGIGPAQSSQRLPHFASSQPWLNKASQLAAASPAAHSGTGVTTPPRVAVSSGGKRGERDGLDTRGLPIPEYPAESRRRGEEGVVMVDVEVLADGTIGQIRVISDAGHPRFASAVLAALRSAAFDPARVDGVPVTGHICIPYRFTLD